ncbi:MAG: InlB B-repeat-containing protein [Bacilli bacterium]|nr:InlB B-repeat-containing protein [Bacilli bacterium]
MKLFKKSLLFVASTLAVLSLAACGGESGGKEDEGGEHVEPTTQYTVTFHDKGAVYDTKKVNAGDLVEAPKDPTPATGFKFAGWYTAETEGTQWSFLTDVVNKDVDLYSRYESTVTKYEVNFWVKGAVVATIQVEEGKKIGDQKPADPTLAANEVFDGWYTQETGGELFNFESTITAKTNIYAHISQKQNSETEVYLAVWGRWLSEENTQKLIAGFKEYADEKSISYTKISYNYYEGYDSEGGNGKYYKIDDFAPAVNGNVDNDVIFPIASNVADRFSPTKTDAYPYSVPYQSGTKTDRYIGRKNEQALTVSLYNWLLSDVANKILNPESETPEQPEVNEQALYIGYYTRYCNATLQKQVKDAFAAYLTAQSISIPTIEPVPFGDDSTNVASLVDLVNNYNSGTHQLDVLIGGGGNILSTAGKETETKLAGSTQDLNINGSSRNMVTFTAAQNPVNAKLFYTFLTSEAGQTALTMPPEEPEEPTETTADLKVLVFRNYFGEAAQQAVEAGFASYLTAQHAAISNLKFVVFDTSTAVGAIVQEVLNKYDASQAYDVVLGGGGNILSTAGNGEGETRKLGDTVGTGEDAAALYTKKADLSISNGTEVKSRNMIYLTKTPNSGNVTLLHNYFLTEEGIAALKTNNPTE